MNLNLTGTNKLKKFWLFVTKSFIFIIHGGDVFLLLKLNYSSIVNYGYREYSSETNG